MTATGASVHDHRRQLELVADSFGDGLCWIDRDGQIADVTVRYAEMVGYDPCELIGSFPPHPAGVAEERAKMVEVAAATLGGLARRIDMTLTARDGSTSHVVVAGSAAPDGEHRAVIAMRDASVQYETERALDRAERRLAAVLGATDQAVWVGDAGGATEWVSDLVAKMLATDARALVGRPLESFVATALRGQARSAYNAVRTDRSSRRIQTVLSNARGGETPVDLRLHPVTDGHGDVTGVAATISDATSLVAGLPARGDATPMDMIDGLVWAADREGRIRYWNEGATRALGYTAAETIGRDASAFLASPQTPEQQSARRQALHRTGSWQGELAVRRRDGTIATLYTRAVQVDDESTSFATVDVAVDMRDLKEQHSRLEEARSYLAAVANSMADGLYAVTADGRLAFMNPAAERMLGWTTSELKGRVMHAVVHYQRPDGTPFAASDCPAAHATKAGEAVRVEECAFTRRDGTLMPVAYTASPIRNANGTVGSVVVFTDISERKAESDRLERELAELNWVKRLEEALDAERVMLYAQPMVELATGAAAQYKLQVRILLDGELVTPDEYLEYVESHSVATAIDRWVLRRACGLAAGGATVKYDLSTRSIHDPLVRSEFKRLLAETGADPSRIVFDLHESAFAADAKATAQFAKVMSAAGCQIGLGNSGTGSGAFPDMSTMPVQYLRIHDRFVNEVVRDPTAESIVRAAVDLARRSDMRTIANGVDDLLTFEKLRELGVDYGRGRALGAAGPVREVLGGGAG